MLRATADSPELYLAVEVSGDYAELLRLMTRRNKFGGGQGSPDLFRPTIRVSLRCVFRPIPATDSDASRPPIPTEPGH